MAMNADYLNRIADHGGTHVTHLSLANGPLATDELAVTRQTVSWTTAVDGDISATDDVTFDVSGGSTVSHVQYWDDVSAGTFLGYSTVTSETFTGDGTYTVTSADINHNAV